MKLTYPILCVVLDGAEHTENEIISRVRHWIKPEQAVRIWTDKVRRGLEDGRRRNKTGRVILSRRRELPQPEDVNVDECIRKVVRSSLLAMGRTYKRKGGPGGYKYVENVDGNGTWRLLPEARELIRNPQVAGNIAEVLRESLRTRGSLP